MEISQNFVAFSEYMNFKKQQSGGQKSPILRRYSLWTSPMSVKSSAHLTNCTEENTKMQKCNCCLKEPAFALMHRGEIIFIAQVHHLWQCMIFWEVLVEVDFKLHLPSTSTIQQTPQQRIIIKLEDGPKFNFHSLLYPLKIYTLHFSDCAHLTKSSNFVLTKKRNVNCP